jgi:hypothetical protein
MRWTKGNGIELRIIWEGSEVKLSEMKSSEVKYSEEVEKRGVLLRIYLCSEETRSERQVKIGMQYLWINYFRNWIE